MFLIEILFSNCPPKSQEKSDFQVVHKITSPPFLNKSFNIKFYFIDIANYFGAVRYKYTTSAKKRILGIQDANRGDKFPLVAKTTENLLKSI